MKVLIVVGHPSPENSSSQQFFRESLSKFANVDFLFLSHEKKGLNYLKNYDRIIFQFPIYWYQAPAILKSWIDDTLVGNLDFLKNKELGIVVTLGVKEKYFQAGARERFTVSEMLRPFEMLANSLDMVYLSPYPIHQFDFLTEVQKKQLLVSYQYYITKTEQDSFENYGKWLVDRLVHVENTDIFIEYINNNMFELEDIKIFEEMHDDN